MIWTTVKVEYYYVVVEVKQVLDFQEKCFYLEIKKKFINKKHERNKPREMEKLIIYTLVIARGNSVVKSRLLFYSLQDFSLN